MVFKDLILVATMRLVDENYDDRVANYCVGWRAAVEQKSQTHYAHFVTRARYSRFERSKFEIDGSNDLMFDIMCYINDRQYILLCDLCVERKTLENVRQSVLQRKTIMCCSLEHPLYDVDGCARVVVDFMAIGKRMYVAGISLIISTDAADKWFEFNQREHNARNKGFDAVVEISVVKTDKSAEETPDAEISQTA